jgi:Type II secretion system (T2SS), protein G
VRGRASAAERIEELLAEIVPPTVAEPTPEVEAQTRWPMTLTAVTALAATVLAWMLLGPAATEDPIAVRGRIESDANALAALVERYHREAHRYPDAATWQLSSQRGDTRFLDPWRQPYLYRLKANTFSISTYGADRQPGGSGTDMDVEMSFPRVHIEGDAPAKPSDGGSS